MSRDFMVGFAEALETKEENFFSLGERKKNANSSIAAILNVTRAFSAILFISSFFHVFKGLKKGKREFVLVFVVYGCFLVTRTATTAPMPTIRTMIMATIPYMTVVFEAKPLSGVAVGAGDDAAGAGPEVS